MARQLRIWVVVILAIIFIMWRIFLSTQNARSVKRDHNQKRSLTQLLTSGRIVPVNISVEFENTTENLGKMETDFFDDLDQTCTSAFEMKGKADCDIDMLEVYDHFTFNDKHQFGDWQQNWKIKIDNSRFNENDKLNVFLLPHSHNDPGWTSTFEQYYERSVRDILNLMLEHLHRNPSLKFIWAEMSFFSLWWDEISNEKKLELKKIVERKQLEFVTGGWVMPDEANSHYYSILIQLFEGNRWLKQHLNYIPKNGWSIDPFGLSPTMAYILKRSGFKNMLIQRTHYLVKQYLGNKQELEFLWRQNWDYSGSTDMRTHMMAFSSYTTADTCGPDRMLCRTFDYREPHGPFSTAMDTTAANVELRSTQLVNQYKKTGMLFKTNNILVPLGADFGWSTRMEWNDMNRNYGNISNFVNRRNDLHTQIRYGTLDEYFSAINSDFHSKNIHLSKLSGDFFTYADRNDHYWSGYFTSRPFHKGLDRRLISNLRSAHAAYTFLSAELFKRSGDLTQFPFLNTLFGYLRNARRTLSLFQHHDGITGTSKDYVMKDYAEKLNEAIQNCNTVMEKSLQILTQIKSEDWEIKLQNKTIDFPPKDFQIELQSILEETPVYSLPTLETIPLFLSSPPTIVTVFNSLGQKRTALVSLKIEIPEDDGVAVQVKDIKGQILDSELFPFFENDTISKNIFHLNFVATQDAISINNFGISVLKLEGNELRPDKPKIYFNKAEKLKIITHDKFDIFLMSKQMNISNGILDVNFNSEGFINNVWLNGKEHHLKIEMFTYGTSFYGGIASGLYLFLPNGPASPFDISQQPPVKVVKGRLQSYVEVSLPLIKHKTIIYSHSGIESNAIEIRNTVDIGRESDVELMMRIQSTVSSGNISYTDLNAFQMIERRRFESLPLQGHYYPMPSASYIEDSHLRLTVLGGQPVGSASLAPGQIEVMMDRTLAEDDGLGVGQGSGEAIKNVNVFKLLLETPSCEDETKEKKAPMLSLSANLMKNELLHPLQIFSGVSTDSDVGFSDYGQHRSVPCDVDFIDAIPLTDFPDSLNDADYSPAPEAALLVRRVGFDARFSQSSTIKQCHSTKLGQLSLDSLFPNLLQPNMTQMSLSFLHELQTLRSSDTCYLEPMEIYAFHIAFHSP